MWENGGSIVFFKNTPVMVPRLWVWKPRGREAPGLTPGCPVHELQVLKAGSLTRSRALLGVGPGCSGTKQEAHPTALPTSHPMGRDFMSHVTWLAHVCLCVNLYNNVSHYFEVLLEYLGICEAFHLLKTLSKNYISLKTTL